MPTIEVVICPQGTSLVETKGFSGFTCQRASAFLEQALGQRNSERLTGEFYQPVETSPHVDERSS